MGDGLAKSLQLIAAMDGMTIFHEENRMWHVQHGIASAERIGAKATVLMVLPPFHTFTIDTQMIEDTPAQYKAHMQKQAELLLGRRQHLSAAHG